MSHLNSGAICKTAIGMIARSAAFIKFENEQRATVLDVLINIIHSAINIFAFQKVNSFDYTFIFYFNQVLEK
jgi:hypothetical protein